MAKVIKDFKERFHNYKKYVVGDDYPEEDKKRVKHLVSLGFIDPHSFTDSGISGGKITTVEAGETVVPLSETKKPRRGKKGADIDANPNA